MMVVLYTTGCPRCKILKKKLDEAGIEYTENNNVDEMLSLGISEVPVLKVNGELLNYNSSIEWLSNREGEVNE